MNTTTHEKVEFIPEFSAFLEQRQPDKSRKITLTDDELRQLAEEHSAEPIKDVKDIYRISQYYLEHNQLRDHMMFLVGLNLGLRISDLLSLKFSDFINPDGTFKNKTVIVEKKTSNRKKIEKQLENPDEPKKHYTVKRRTLGLSDESKSAISRYISSLSNFDVNWYMFRSDVAIKYTRENKPMSRQAAQYVLNQAFDTLGIKTRHGTHVLRKTFAYHVLTKTDNPFQRARNLEKLQKILNHSSPSITLAYAGITQEEQLDIYHNMNYGLELI